MPSETPTAPVRNMAASASWTVAASRSVTTCSAGARYWKDWPKSPRTTLRMKITYWHVERLAQAEMPVQLVHRGLGRALREQHLGRVAGQDAEDHEHQNRDAEERQGRLAEPAEGVRPSFRGIPGRARLPAGPHGSPAPGYAIATSLSRT